MMLRERSHSMWCEMMCWCVKFAPLTAFIAHMHTIQQWIYSIDYSSKHIFIDSFLMGLVKCVCMHMCECSCDCDCVCVWVCISLCVCMCKCVFLNSVIVVVSFVQCREKAHAFMRASFEKCTAAAQHTYQCGFAFFTFIREHSVGVSAHAHTYTHTRYIALHVCNGIRRVFV